MKFVSTRGQAPAVGFLQAASAGAAPDGGLYLPESWPVLEPQAIARLAARPYAEALGEVLAAFIGEELERDAALDIGREVASAFAHAATAPLSELYPNVWLLELFHGPTLSAADASMQMLASLYERELAGQDRTPVLVMAGAAAEAAAAVRAFAMARHVRLVVLFPERGVSEAGRHAITASGAGNVRALAIDGDRQDCMDLAAALLADTALADADLRDIGPRNIGRIVADIAVMIHAAAKLGAPGRLVSFAVPAGDFAMGVSAYGARRMGVPVSRIVAACNANDALARVFQDGRYARSPLQHTRTPSLDVQAPLNFERLYAEAVEREALETRRAMAAFADLGAIDMPPSARNAFADIFAAAAVSDDDTARAMISTLNETGALVGPDTAVVLAAAQRLAARDRSTPMVALGLAHAAQDAAAVTATTGVAPARPPQSRPYAEAAERFERLPAEAEAVKAFVRAFAAS
jgi:threonine synthase